MISPEVERVFREPEEFISRLRILNQNNQITYLFPFWYEQAAWLDALMSGKRYVLGLKPRQVGFTTTTAAYLFWLLYTSRDPLLCWQIIHEQDAMTRMAEMIRVYHAGLPAEIRGRLAVNNSKRTQFAHNGAQFVRVVAGGRGQGRSWSANHLHATEMAKWPTGTAASSPEGGSADEEMFSSIMATMHDPGRRIIVESTGNGPRGLFFDLYEQAKTDPEWAFVFVPWHHVPRYREDVADPERFEDDLTDDERQLRKDFDLSLEQLHWRQIKMRSERWSLIRFQREYPMTDIEPFLLSESGWFEQKNLIRLLRWISTQNLGAAAAPFRVFKSYEPRRRYAMGVDTSGGSGRDEASIQVIRDDGLHVATWNSKHASPYEQAQMVSRIGGLYGKPLCLIEANNFGAFVIAEVSRLGGVTLWTTSEGKPFSSTGSTAGNSKRDVMAYAREVIDSQHTIVQDAETVRQAQRVVEKSNGRIEGGHHSHDDRIMSYCFALWAARRFRFSKEELDSERNRLRAIEAQMRRFERAS